MSYFIFIQEGSSSRVYVPKNPIKGGTCTIKATPKTIQHVKQFTCGTKVILLENSNVIILPGKVLKEMQLDQVYLLTSEEYRKARSKADGTKTTIEFFKQMYPHFPKTAQLMTPVVA